MGLILKLSLLVRGCQEFPAAADIKKRSCPGGGGHDRFY